MVRGAAGVAGLAGLTLAGGMLNPLFASAGAFAGAQTGEAGMVGTVALGNTGLVVSQLALGTGSVGGNGGSNQTRLGYEAFTRLFRRAYDRGIRFTDMAEGYGSMPFVAEAIKGLPRENLVLLSKMWPYAEGTERFESVMGRIEDYLRQLGTDHLDSLLLHCMNSADWNVTRQHYMEVFSRAKEKGLIRSVGVSCHDFGALEVAADDPWVEVIFARINPFGANMDGSPEEVSRVLQRARANGKGVVGMKIFGEGTRVKEHEMDRSISFAIRESGVHAITIGMETMAQIDANADRVIRIAGRNA